MNTQKRSRPAFEYSRYTLDKFFVGDEETFRYKQSFVIEVVFDENLWFDDTHSVLIGSYEELIQYVNDYNFIVKNEEILDFEAISFFWYHNEAMIGE